LPLAVSEHVLCLWRTLHAVLPAVVMLAVGLGPVIIYELLQLLHLSDQGLYGVPVIRTVAHEHVAPRSRGRLRRRCCWCRLRMARRNMTTATIENRPERGMEWPCHLPIRV